MFARMSAFAAGMVLIACARADTPINVGWLAVTPAEMEMKAPRVEKDAGAEALFWRVYVVDEVQGEDIRSVLYHYVRIKIFNERGKEQQGTIDIPYFGKTAILDVAGRTIKPDGSILDLRKNAIFDRDLVKGNGLKVRAKSFAMPGVEPGCIVEYRWRENRNGQLANYVRLQLQREIPVQMVKYYIKPLNHPYFPFGMRTMAFQFKFNGFVAEKDGFHSTFLENVPAFKEEPRMPPEDQVRPWILIYYSEDKKVTPEKYWIEFGKKLYNDTKPQLKVNDDVRRAAESAIEDAKDPEEKLARLIRYCRTQIKNLRDDDVTEQQRAKAKQNRSPGETLKHGAGTGLELNMLFAAMASAAGFEARYARLSDRSDTFFNRGFPDSYFLRTYDVAVKVNDTWRFYDVTTNFLPAGMLRWQEEGVTALVSDPKNPVFVDTVLSPPDKSRRMRNAKLELKEDGSIEGDVTLAYTGHAASDRRQEAARESATQREEDLKDMVKRQYSTAEISAVKIENLQDAEKPATYSYHVKIPGFAQRTGRRLFLQPSYFHVGYPAMFPTSERKHGIYYQYPWREDDTVEIQLPAGFEFDNADAPAPLEFGKPGRYDVSLAVTPAKQLVYRRTFVFGREGAIMYPVAAYPNLKAVMDTIHQRDNHTITLKQADKK